jgi:hypothetical protein
MTTSPATQDQATSILRDIAALMTDLADLSNAKHGQANAHGSETPNGRHMEGQSHAYANAAVMLESLLDQYVS